jgi:hypothetical protein
MLDHAEASLAAFGIDIGFEADIARTRGFLAREQNSLDEAARQYERSLDLERDVGGTSAGWELIEIYTEFGRTADAQALKSRLTRKATPPLSAPPRTVPSNSASTQSRTESSTKRSPK